ncbi:hypothetical protein AYO38_07705 [bacterium SCGC AG-212-C10]|nr:hypothetical protein AYO38_07705 [bacterium SCGC AG-212-C10]
MSAYEFLSLEIEDPVAVITLNRPEKLNALTHPMIAEIHRAVDEAAGDRRVVGIILTGTGRGFCAGLDSQALASITASKGADREPVPDTDVPGLFTYFLDVPKPMIAAVNGVAAGGGLTMAMMCDVRFASTAASFTTVFLKRGLISEHGTSWSLPRMLGPGRALDLLWTSDRIDATRAHEIGFVEFLTEPEQLLAEARAYVQKIAENASPGTVADTKKLVYRHLGMGYADALRDAESVQWQAVARPDAAEGARALLERRPAVFERLGS